MLDLNAWPSGNHTVFRYGTGRSGGRAWNHRVTFRMYVQGSINTRAWPEVTERTLRCWNDEEVTTEHGAVGIAETGDWLYQVLGVLASTTGWERSLFRFRTRPGSKYPEFAKPRRVRQKRSDGFTGRVRSGKMSVSDWRVDSESFAGDLQIVNQ